MNGSWAALKESVRKYWAKLTRAQKVITIAAPLLVAIAFITLILWASRPQYTPLFTKMSEANAAAVRNKLVELKIPYQLADGGATISVPAAQANEARLQLASAGVPQGSKFSFDSLNQLHLGETDADRKLRYVLGLQDELAGTLKTLTGVQEALVHIVMPEPSLFVEKEKAATAGVTLKLVPGTKMTDEQVRGVANLLSASVEGLQPENVTILDTSGNVLSDGIAKQNDPSHLTGSQLELQQAVEDKTRKSVQSMLDQALGAGSTIVRANASLNFDQVKEVSELHGPGATVSKQATDETATNGTAQGGVPGTTPNTGNAATYQQVGGAMTSNSTKKSSTENFVPDKTQTEKVVAPGAVKRLSISVMADQNRVNQAQLDQIKGIVASAAGIDAARGDTIQVAAIPFDTTAVQAQKAALAKMEQNRRNLQYAEIGVAVLGGLFLLLFVLRSRSKRKRAAQGLALNQTGDPLPFDTAAEILMAQQRAEAEAQAKLEQKKAKTAVEIEKQKIKESVEVYTRNNSDEVARLLKTWLSEER
ncbi:MAG: flagellar basal-body MS-ring/collar protein FliF [Desulfitobacteriaceae bacterium]|nr:flagellar basal-body MS-ring/collar protein FliF [Desulfitobacteriaceae bacterium]MDI6878883.1 flagellar basal-body MS-ring/collar protein FliF [Desulfitobacteriaceae bacterium]MDI6914496.1 flagellar basal-body MS-ring/collar protein FliF [Desulfitobacteriaceae bacterium]